MGSNNIGRLDEHRTKKNLREAVLERDDYRCQLDLFFGISALSGVPCSERFERHHKSYDQVGAGSGESIDDLITVCSRCHGLITSAVRKVQKEHGKPADGSLAGVAQRIKDLLGERERGHSPIMRNGCGLDGNS